MDELQVQVKIEGHGHREGDHSDEDDALSCPHDRLDEGVSSEYQLCRDQEERMRQLRETDDDIAGPGRTLDTIYTLMGVKICELVVEAKKVLHRGVSGASHAISKLRRHDELTIVDLYESEGSDSDFLAPSDSDLKKIKKYCERLVRYARCVPPVCSIDHSLIWMHFRSKSPQKRLAAYSVITNFAVLDPVVRAVLLEVVREQKDGHLSQIDKLVQEGKSPTDVALLYDNSHKPSFAKAWRAIVALERREIHDLWKKFHVHLTCGETPKPELLEWYSKDFLPDVVKHMK